MTRPIAVPVGPGHGAAYASAYLIAEDHRGSKA
jgi:hypothetical protein